METFIHVCLMLSKISIYLRQITINKHELRQISLNKQEYLSISFCLFMSLFNVFFLSNGNFYSCLFNVVENIYLRQITINKHELRQISLNKQELRQKREAPYPQYI